MEIFSVPTEEGDPEAWYSLVSTPSKLGGDSAAAPSIEWTIPSNDEIDIQLNLFT